MSRPLDNASIAKLLTKDKAQATSGRGKRGPKIDKTETRDTATWFTLSHHMCMPDCEHRTLVEGEPLTKACQNPNCVDPRPSENRGTCIVSEVKGQRMCRYCFLAGYLKDE